ncbi:MAG: hypothetical protein AAF587_16580 [Bacteroidota bacterium]
MGRIRYGANTSSHMTKESLTSLNWRAIGLMIQNFVFWFIPGILVLALFLLIVLILVGAATSGNDIDLYKKMPKGLVSFLGIAFLLSGIAFVVLMFVIPELGGEGIIFLITATIVCWVLAYIGIKREYQRLSHLYV